MRLTPEIFAQPKQLRSFVAHGLYTVFESRCCFMLLRLELLERLERLERSVLILFRQQV